MNRVYVDDAAIMHRSMLMYHLFSPDLDALHAMAQGIGMERRWFQDPATMPDISWPHYDIPHMIRGHAIELGAIPVDRYQMFAMANVILGRKDPLRAFRSPYFKDQCERLTRWLAEQGYPI